MALLTNLSLALLGALPAGGADVEISLPAAASCGGLEIHVEDIAAAVTGLDPEAVARVKAASLGYAPAPGYSRVLRADLVEASLRAAMPGVSVEVTGAPRCRVTPRTVVIKGSEVQAVAATELRKALVGLDASADLEGVVADIELPSGEVEPRIAAALPTRTIQPGLVNVQAQVWFGDRLYRTVSVGFRVKVWRRQAVLRRAVNAGDSLHAGLFEVKRVPIEDAIGLQALALDELAGAVTLRPLPAGGPVLERDVHRQVVVDKGDLVTVQLSKGAVKVTDVGVVVAEGRMGERVGVQLRSTGRQLIGVVRGPQLVEVKIQ